MDTIQLINQEIEKYTYALDALKHVRGLIKKEPLMQELVSETSVYLELGDKVLHKLSKHVYTVMEITHEFILDSRCVVSYKLDNDSLIERVAAIHDDDFYTEYEKMND